MGSKGLTEAEHDAAKERDPDIPMASRTLLEYGEAREGYWTGAQFMKQMKGAVKVAEAKYPKGDDN